MLLNLLRQWILTFLSRRWLTEHFAPLHSLYLLVVLVWGEGYTVLYGRNLISCHLSNQVWKFRLVLVLNRSRMFPRGLSVQILQFLIVMVMINFLKDDLSVTCPSLWFFNLPVYFFLDCFINLSKSSAAGTFQSLLLSMNLSCSSWRWMNFYPSGFWKHRVVLRNKWSYIPCIVLLAILQGMPL